MFDKIKTLVSHVIVYGLGNSGSRLLGFLLIPLYTRYLTPADYGILALVNVFSQVLFIVMSMGQGTSVFRTYFTHDDPERRNAVITTSLSLILGLSFPVGLVAIALANPLASLLVGTPGYASWVALGVAGMAFKTLLRLPFAVLRAREESRRYALSSSAQTLVSLGLTLMFVAGLHLGGRGVLLSQLLAELVICVYLLPVTLRGLRPKFSRDDAVDLLGYGLYQIPTALLSSLLQMSDRFFLRHFATLEAVGLYALGFRLGEVLSYAMWAFTLAWQPFIFANRKHQEAPTLFARVTTYYVALMAFLWLALSLLAEEVVRIMARPAYHEAYRVVPWVAGAFFFQSIAYVTSVGIDLYRKVQYRPVIIGVAAGANLGLNAILVPPYGMMGAAVAATVSFGLWFLLQALVSSRLYPVPYEYGRLARLAVIGGGLYLAGTVIPWGPLWAAVTGKALLLLAAPLLLYASGFFEAGELARARGLITVLRRGAP